MMKKRLIVVFILHVGKYILLVFFWGFVLSLLLAFDRNRLVLIIRTTCQTSSSEATFQSLRSEI